MAERASGQHAGVVRDSPKVGRKPAFTSEEAVAAALAEGIDRFTLSAVADRLGVVTAAIYRLFSSREDLVIACLDTAGATIARPAPDLPWREALRLWAGECWRVCEDYPGLSRLVYSFPLAPTRITAVFAAYTECLTSQGRTAEQAMFAISIIADCVFASRWSLEARRAAGGAHPADSSGDRASVDRKIDFIIAGLEQHWPQP